MRQVTGRSSNNSTLKASIRLASGGRFFSATNLANVAENEDVLVVVDTARVTLVTPQIASELSAADILAINGQSPLLDEIAVLSSEVDNKIAVIAVNQSAYEQLNSRFGNRLHFTSPLLSVSHSDEVALAIEVSDNNYYIRLYNNGLQVAEALELCSGEELLYYVANILEIAAVNIPYIYIKGAAKDTVKLLKKYYKVICE